MKALQRFLIAINVVLAALIIGACTAKTTRRPDSAESTPPPTTPTTTDTALEVPGRTEELAAEAEQVQVQQRDLALELLNQLLEEFEKEAQARQTKGNQTNG